MSVKEAISRGLNFFAIAILAMEGFQSLLEAISENEWNDKADDIVFTIISIVGVVWYLKSRDKFKATFIPGTLLLLALFAKIGAFIIERDDDKAIGPDYGILIMILLTIIIFTWQFYFYKRLRSPDYKDQ